MTATFRCPCGTTATRRADDTGAQAKAFDAIVRLHFGEDVVTEHADLDVITDHPTPEYQPVRASGVTRELDIAWT